MKRNRNIDTNVHQFLAHPSGHRQVPRPPVRLWHLRPLPPSKDKPNCFASKNAEAVLKRSLFNYPYVLNKPTPNSGNHPSRRRRVCPVQKAVISPLVCPHRRRPEHPTPSAYPLEYPRRLYNPSPLGHPLRRASDNAPQRRDEIIGQIEGLTVVCSCLLV